MAHCLAPPVQFVCWGRRALGVVCLSCVVKISGNYPVLYRILKYTIIHNHRYKLHFSTIICYGNIIRVLFLTNCTFNEYQFIILKQNLPINRGISKMPSTLQKNKTVISSLEVFPPLQFSLLRLIIFIGKTQKQSCFLSLFYGIRY